jgi:hypothetical protein
MWQDWHFEEFFFNSMMVTSSLLLKFFLDFDITLLIPFAVIVLFEFEFH